MTSDLSNLHIAAPYPANDTVTGANGEGLTIANFGSSNIPTKSHNFKLNYVLHDKVTQRTLFQGLSNNAIYPIPVFKPSTVPPVAFLEEIVNSTL
ncbi:hypothetical protein ACFX2A_042182 [Malus domestica]